MICLPSETIAIVMYCTFLLVTYLFIWADLTPFNMSHKFDFVTYNDQNMPTNQSNQSQWYMWDNVDQNVITTNQINNDLITILEYTSIRINNLLPKRFIISKALLFIYYILIVILFYFSVITILTRDELQHLAYIKLNNIAHMYLI